MSFSPWWFLVGLAVFQIGLTKSGFGSGLGLLVVPMAGGAMAHIAGYGFHSALGLVLPLLSFGDLIALWQYRRELGLKIITPLLLPTAIGIGLGSLVLWWFSRHEADLAAALVKIEIGAESVILVSLHWLRGGDRAEPWVPKPHHSWLSGVFAGASSTLAHAAGPIIALYLLPQKLGRTRYVATTALYFFLLNMAKMPAYWASGQFALVSPWFSARFVPVVILGAAVGFMLVRKLSDRGFSRVVYFGTFAVGWYILIDGARAALRML